MPYTIFSNVDVGNNLVNKSARLFEERICSSLDMPFIASLKTLSRKTQSEKNGQKEKRVQGI